MFSLKVSVLFYIFIFAILCNAQEPIRLIGEGEYNINVLKEIKGTDSFLSLGEDARECQTVEPLYNCTTRKYKETILGECGCLPFNIRISSKVHLYWNIVEYF